MVALSAAIVICVTGIASWKQVQENTEWGVLFLFGGGLTLSSVLTQSGASKIMADGIVFIIEGGHYYVMALIVAAFIVCLTEFTSKHSKCCFTGSNLYFYCKCTEYATTWFCDDYRLRGILCLYDAGWYSTECDCLLDRFCETIRNDPRG